MNPALNGSTALQRFKCGNVVKIGNGIMFDFYPGLPYMSPVLTEVQQYSDFNKYFLNPDQGIGTWLYY